jgi:ABC-type bacteriocin/lantibiotic exporter with double-glycine peptidase domain
MNIVHQKHDFGCFVACAAMLLDISYEDAFKKILPKHNYDSWSYSAWQESDLSIEKGLEVLSDLGIKVKRAKLRNVKSLKKRTSLIFLRWKTDPDLMHTLVFDGKQGKILDPLPSHIKPITKGECNRNLEAIYYVSRNNGKS